MFFHKRNKFKVTLGVLLTVASIMVSTSAYAVFDSGSSCNNASDPDCLGALSPTVNTEVQLPPDGILDYTTVSIPSGVTVTFKRNAANTPVIIRTTGNVTIAGTISVSGAAAKHSGTAGDSLLGDDGQPGLGGPGGFDGGMGGYSPLFGGVKRQLGGGGKGPGGGQPGGSDPNNWWPNNGTGGGGGGYAAAGAAGYYGGGGGGTYGQATILPLIGGSGGAGGGSGLNYNGGGGGGGGGAILIASSSTITLSGNIYADGGPGGASQGDGCGGGGGAGSGGAVRLVADTIVRTAGAVYARGSGAGSSCVSGGGNGGAGRIRFESNNGVSCSGYTDPNCSVGTPGKVLVPNNPTLRISKVNNISISADPTGVADVTLPEGTASVPVEVEATNIPRGTTVTIYAVPASGSSRTSVLTGALSGASDALTTATSVSNISLAGGNNVLMAAATYTVTEIIAASMPTFNGERVAQIRVEAGMDGKSRIVYITPSGKEYPQS
ncbi:MAG: hypothetical protein AB1805_01770 [Nitrospirota bacterium]